MGLAIVVLAAGLGTRYQSLKQLAPLGPSGEALLDYTLYDAAAAGFSEAVLVVADEIVDAMTAHLDAFAPPVAVQLRVQNANGPRRAAPWGTAHAALVGAEGLTVPFAVANADDLYGTEALAAMAAHLQPRDASHRARSAAVVAYAANATLSPRGGVSRAVCRVDDDGHLLSVEEHTGMRRTTAGRLVSDTAVLSDTTPVSMNLWGFDPAFLDRLRPVVTAFFAAHLHDDRELRLPDVVGDLTNRGAIDVTVLTTAGAWLGITHPDDGPEVRATLAALTAAGVYPTLATGSRTSR